MYHPKDAVTEIAQHGARVVRLLRSAVGFQALGPRAVSEDEEKPETYMVSNRRMQEIETQKAFVRAVSNSDKWKAGGPY